MTVYKKSLVLVGMMGSGKSKVGGLLSVACNLPFVDSDRLIEASEGASISDLFKNKGEPYFRRCERDTIIARLKQAPCVLASGGGAYMQKPVQEACRQYATSYFLDMPVGDLWHRVKSSNRPLVQAGYDAFAELWNVRHPTYATADRVIDCQGKTPAEIVADILA